MPHTSHKKKQARSKRQEIVGDDGWTRITSTRSLAMPLLRRSEWVMEVAVEEAPEGLTQADVLAKYTDVEKRWNASESWKSMEHTLKTRVIGSDAKIDACVLFGSGTFTGLREGWIDRAHVALYQLAAFKAIVDLVEQCTGQRPAACAQEPQYNTLDGVFLNTLGIQKMDDPQGFNLLTKRSFAFCPGAEQYVLLETLATDPFLYLGGALDSYTGVSGYLQSSVINVHYYVYRPRNPKEDEQSQAMSLEEIEELKEEMTDATGVKLDKAWVQKKRASEEQDVHVIERFLRNREVAMVPNLDVQDQPMYDTSLYWLREWV